MVQGVSGPTQWEQMPGGTEPGLLRGGTSCFLQLYLLPAVCVPKHFPLFANSDQCQQHFAVLLSLGLLVCSPAAPGHQRAEAGSTWALAGLCKCASEETEAHLQSVAGDKRCPTLTETENCVPKSLSPFPHRSCVFGVCSVTGWDSPILSHVFFPAFLVCPQSRGD